MLEFSSIIPFHFNIACYHMEDPTIANRIYSSLYTQLAKGCSYKLDYFSHCISSGLAILKRGLGGVAEKTCTMAAYWLPSAAGIE